LAQGEQQKKSVPLFVFLRGETNLENRVRALAEGALTAGVFAILLLLSIYTPLQIVTVLLLALPFTIYGARHGMRLMFAVAVVAALIGFMLGGLIGFIYAVTSSLMGGGMGVSYYYKKPAIVALVMGTVFSLTGLLITLFVSIYVLGLDQITSYQQLMNETIDQTVTFLQKMGQQIPKEQIDLIRTQLSLLPRMIPFAMLLSSVISAMINHAIARKIAKRLGMQFQAFPPFREWRLPRSIIFYYTGVLILSLIPFARENEWVFSIILNARPLLEILIIIQGLSFIYFWAERKNWNKRYITVAVIFAALFLFQGFAFILIFIGMMDFALDLRSRISINK
jgi:uncharacterized protein YybS (DUF2232 family)